MRKLSLFVLSLLCIASGGCPPAEGGEDASTSAADSGSLPDAPGLDATAPDAAAPVACDMEGAMRTAACGNCGLESQRCESGVWTTTGPCIGEGECAMGTTEMRASATCGEEARICLDMCRWSAWDEITPGMGECTVGEERSVPDGCSPGVARLERCSAMCAWEPTGTCADPCGSDRRTEPAWAEERCIPAGPFMRGDDSIMDARPVAEIMMSAYYIDRYQVTNLRYRACVEAGACTAPAGTEGAAFEDRTRDDYPVGGVTWDQADAFCRWDGRALPTEAQWEKAMRGGSATDRPVYPWGSEMDCDLLPVRECGATPDGMRRTQDPYDAFPGVESPFGVGGVGLADEWVFDFYRYDYYFVPDSLGPDPEGPMAGAPGTTRSRVIRGCSRFGAVSRCRVAFRASNGGEFANAGRSFRCARRTS